MSHLLLVLLYWAWPDIHGLRREPPSVPGLKTIKELAASNGYEATDIEVLTEDGCSLWMHRIGNNLGPPVLVQHGIFVASEPWIVRGVDKDLVFLLLGQGYDVWLANQRGTVYNEYCLTYNRSDPRFWDFSFHESGYYDTPAFIDTILSKRGLEQLFYIGHSLGTTVFLVMASSRPEYNSKVQAAALLSPIAFPPSSEEMQPLLQMLLHNAHFLYKGLMLMGQHELAFRTSASVKSMKDLCGHHSITQSLCFDIIGLFSGEHRTNLNKKDYEAYMTYFGAGTSSKTLYHLAQLYRTGEFKQFDYEYKYQNFIRYNSTKPPLYHLNLVSAPIALFWGYNDRLLSKTSVERLTSKLPNLIFSRPVPDPLFTHIDMFLGINANQVLFPDIINLFNSYL